MAAVETIETRLVSGTGVLRIPTDKRDRRTYTLFAQVIRPPRSPYLSLKSNPPESFYGKIACVKGDTVYKIFPQEFENQAWEFIPDIAGQALIAIKCAYDGILITFENLGFALQTPPITYVNTIKEYKNLQLPFDEFRIVCYADSAIQLTLKAIEFESCSTSKEPPQEPPPPPPSPEQVPFNTPLNISPPYDDDPITKKAQIDEDYVPPPTGNPCATYTVTFSYTNADGARVSASRVLYGEIGRIKEASGPGEPSQIQLEFRGFPGFTACGEFQFRRLTGGGPGNLFQNPTIDSID